MLLDAFMKFEEPSLMGESRNAEHTDEISILSLDHAILREPLAAGSKAGTNQKPRSEHRPVTIIKQLDKASPKLYQACCQGTVYQKVTIYFRQPGRDGNPNNRVVYLEILLEGVNITRAHLVGDPKLQQFGKTSLYTVDSAELIDLGPLEEVDLNYTKIQWLYKGETGKMNISGKWDLTANA